MPLPTSRSGRGVVRVSRGSLRFPPFALAFVNQVADAAEAARHHPDIDIRYTNVTLAYWTHDSGGITQSDIKAAASIDLLFDGVSA